MDIILLLIAIPLIVTLSAFYSGLIPYPFGWMILSSLLIARLLYLAARD